MKTYVVVQERLSFAVDWSTVHCPHQFRLLLITSPHAYEHWGAKQTEYFERIFVENCMDYETLHKIMLTIVNEYQGDKIYVINNEEFNLLKCAQLRKAFGLQGDTEEVITIFRNKLLMKARLIENGLAHVVPRFKVFDPAEVSADYPENLVDTLGLPIFCKPTAGSGAKNACILNNTEEISSWIQKNMNQSSGAFEFDQFITGEMYHCDSIVKNNKTLHAQVFRYLYPCFDFHKGRLCASIVVLPDDPVYTKILNFNETIFNGLQSVPDCVTHNEFFKTEDDRFIFVEIAARPPGVLICPAHELNIGLDLKLVHYKLQMGLDFNLLIQPGFHSAWATFPKKAGKVVQLNYPTHLKSNFYFEHSKEDATSPRRNLWLPSSNILLWNTNYEILEKDLQSLKYFSPTETIED